MARTFDSGDFDIHEFENQKPEVFPVSKKEKIDPRVLKGLSTKPEKRARWKRILVGLVGNIFLPGLGNVILKKNTISGILLIANIALLIATISPTSILGFLGNMASPEFPPILASTVTIAPAAEIGEVGELSIVPEMLPVFYLAIAVAFVTWLHFFSLAVEERH